MISILKPGLSTLPVDDAFSQQAFQTGAILLIEVEGLLASHPEAMRIARDALRQLLGGGPVVLVEAVVAVQEHGDVWGHEARAEERQGKKQK